MEGRENRSVPNRSVPHEGAYLKERKVYMGDRSIYADIFPLYASAYFSSSFFSSSILIHTHSQRH